MMRPEPAVAVLPTNEVQFMKHLIPRVVPDPALSCETVADTMFNPARVEQPLNASSLTVITDAGTFRTPPKLLQLKKD